MEAEKATCDDATFKLTDARNGKCFECPKCVKYEIKKNAARLIRKGGIDRYQISAEAAAAGCSGYGLIR